MIIEDELESESGRNLIWNSGKSDRPASFRSLGLKMKFSDFKRFKRDKTGLSQQQVIDSDHEVF